MAGMVALRRGRPGGTVENVSESGFKRPDGTRRFFFAFPGTEVPGYFHSFPRNDPRPIFAEVSFSVGAISS
jgi:hypothetical protein